MTIRCFTSITRNYLPKAKALAQSVRRHHPAWEFHIVMCEPSDLVPNELFDRVWHLEDLELPSLASWVFSHQLVEVCTGVKGAALSALLNLADTEAVVYLDPDIVVLSPLKAVVNALRTSSIVLTPHQLAPDQRADAIIDNEICSLLHGVYNLGFIAVSADEQGFAFGRWWRDRLIDHCWDDKPRGLFTDQRWCDLIPAFFDRHHILRDPGYNVATWNLSQRRVTMSDDGEIRVNGQPLAFYHFTGYDSGAGRTMLNKYGAPDSPVFELWDWYDRTIAEHGQGDSPEPAWAYNAFDDGTPILPQMRSLYRSRQDLKTAFPDPFNVTDDPTFLAWWHAHQKSPA